MSRIKGKNTRPEIIVRKWLWKNGYRYRIHRKDLPGKPDIVLPKYHAVIFVNGCFWHGHDCRYFKWPKTNKGFWENKINNTIGRDQKNYAYLVEKGWRYFIVWECQIKAQDPKIFTNLMRFIENEIERPKNM